MLTEGTPKPPVKPQKQSFDWIIYRDATLAGLSPLIPIPLIDWLFEEIFRRAMPGSIAKRHKRKLHPQSISAINQGGDLLTSCLMLPVWLILELFKRLSRKILYFLAVKEASDKVALYWRQAYLIDYMVRRGHLDHPISAQYARKAMDLSMRNLTISPLTRLAEDIVRSSRHIFRSLWRARRGVEDETITRQKTHLIRNWGDYTQELEALAGYYEHIYHQLQQPPPPPPPPPAPEEKPELPPLDDNQVY